MSSVFKVCIKCKEKGNMAQQVNVAIVLNRIFDYIEKRYKLDKEPQNPEGCYFTVEDESGKLTREALLEMITNLDRENYFKINVADITEADDWDESDVSFEELDEELDLIIEPAKSKILQDIHSMVGNDEFKAMADELFTIGDRMAKIPGYVSRNTFMFSMDEGYGLTTALSRLAALAKELKMIPNDDVAEMSFLTDTTDPQMINRLMIATEEWLEKRRKCGVLCVDLRKCYDAIGRAEYREILRMCAYAEKHLLVFRVPFLERRIQKQIEDQLKDLFFIHTVTFTPFDMDELFECAARSAESMNFKLDQSMRPTVADMVAREKSDGKFYGIKTMHKIVTELIYEKLLKQKDAQDTIISASHDAGAASSSQTDELSGEEELAGLIGMEDVAKQIEEIVSLMTYAKKNGTKTPSLHMRFVGPPGTGKTTVARLVGKILKEHHILRTGVFFEYTGNDFLAKYVGHTAAKTAQICRDAYGGVLFIDEAYSLAYGDEHFGGGSFREEAMNTLLAQMENHRDDMVVIMAGYEHEIDQMLESNPGLAQRVPYVVRFNKYTKEQLAEIFFVQAKKEFDLDDKIRQHIRDYFLHLPNNVYYGPNFANARFVRNLYERVISKAAMRQRLEKQPGRQMMISDFDKAAKDIEKTLTGSMTYGKDASGAVMFSEEDAQIGFKDVCGQDEAKELLAEMIDFIKYPAKYKKIGAVIPKGALLCGPPGTGKTMLAKAAAGEARVPVLTISGSDLIGKFVGEGPEKVRQLFAQARKMAPSIIFIDEIDAIGTSRNRGGSGDTLIQLLTEMDGFGSSEHVMVLAATNQPQALDPALTRPGRLDREIPVELPELEGRIQILAHYLKNTISDKDIDLREVANLASGMSGADLKNVVNEAALRAIREGRAAITHADLEESIEVVSVGYQKKGNLLSPKEKWIVCYHEIGHALAAALQTHSAPVKKITVLPRTGGALGYARQLDPEVRYLHTKTELENRIVTIVAGRAAEEVHFHEVTTGASNDIEKATQIARMLVTRYGMTDEFDMVSFENTSQNYLGSSSEMNCSDETARLIDKKVVEIVKTQHQKAIELLKANEDKLDALAKYVYEKETITGEQFMEILNQLT